MLAVLFSGATSSGWGAPQPALTSWNPIGSFPTRAACCPMPEPRPDMARARELHESSDADLLQCCLQGDAHAWRELVRRYSRLVLGVPRAMGLQRDDADEVFQNTFAALHRTLPRIEDPSRIESWLVTASRRAALRLIRDRRRHQQLDARHLAEQPPALAPAADEAIERLRERERVARALASVSEPCRTLLTALFSDHGMSYRELGERLGLAVGSLGAQRARCLQQLRVRLMRSRTAARRPS